MFVWEASLEIEWESGYPLGLFHKKSDAKKACQNHATDDGKGKLDWNVRDANHATAGLTGYSSDYYSVLRRKVL